MTAPARGLNSFERPVHQFRYYDLCVIVFVVVLLISNLIGPKIVAVGPFRISGAQLLFPITYIFGDIFTEVYGYAGSRRAIWLGFFGSALMAVMGIVVVALPAAPDFKDQAAFATVFGFVPRMVAASLVAYWAGEFANSYVMARMKVCRKRQRPLDAHHRLHRRRPAGRLHRHHGAGLRRQGELVHHWQPDLLRLLRQGRCMKR